MTIPAGEIILDGHELNEQGDSPVHDIASLLSPNNNNSERASAFSCNLGIFAKFLTQPISLGVLAAVSVFLGSFFVKNKSFEESMVLGVAAGIIVTTISLIIKGVWRGVKVRCASQVQEPSLIEMEESGEIGLDSLSFQ